MQHIWAQDLLADKSEDIKSLVKTQGSKLVISGELIDRIGLSAATPGDISVPGLVIRLEGKKLPVAGDEFTPVVKIPTAAPKPRVPAKKQSVDGFSGTASIQKVPFGYAVSSTTQNPGFVLKKLSKPITSGKATFTWKMKDSKAATRNGFLVLSSDDDALSSVFSGAWTGSGKLSSFESVGAFQKDKQASFQPSPVMDCTLELDMDACRVVLSINGKKLENSLTESVTGINYIGFATRKATTHFTEPVIKR